MCVSVITEGKPSDIARHVMTLEKTMQVNRLVIKSLLKKTFFINEICLVMPDFKNEYHVRFSEQTFIKIYAYTI